MPKILEVVDIHTYYGESHILQGVSLSIEEGKVAVLLGRNGMGKTTTIRSVWGLTPPRRGVVRFRERDISGLRPYQIVQMGIAVVPQGRQIFPSLSVRENLTMAARKGSWTLERVYSLFPLLAQRSGLRGNLISGGEQQMLSIARALMTNPELLIMDEPSEGLAPLLVQQVGEVIRELNREGLSILLVEQNLRMATGVADYVYILSKGQVVYESTPQGLRDNPEVREKYLGVA